MTATAPPTRILIVTGMSGAGKSTALRTLEDIGWEVVDNLPLQLLDRLLSTPPARTGETIPDRPLALGIDTRTRDFNAERIIRQLRSLRKDPAVHLDMLFLDCGDNELARRFSETRRSHPLSHRIRSDQSPSDMPTLLECILRERDMLSAVEGIGHVIDTSGLSANKLRAWIKELVETTYTPLTLLFESFAFKFGVPLDADLVFDVRVLPNPFYDIALRPLTGRDAPVQAFLKAQDNVATLIADIRGFIEKWLPSFKNDNRSYLTVAIGCTGGQHRSVYVAEQLAAHFGASERVILRHRELN